MNKMINYLETISLGPSKCHKEDVWVAQDEKDGGKRKSRIPYFQ